MGGLYTRHLNIILLTIVPVETIMKETSPFGFLIAAAQYVWQLLGSSNHNIEFLPTWKAHLPPEKINGF